MHLLEQVTTFRSSLFPCNFRIYTPCFRCRMILRQPFYSPVEDVPMHFALIPCIICAAIGAAGGWIVRDRDYYKSKDEEAANSTAGGQPTAEGEGN